MPRPAYLTGFLVAVLPVLPARAVAQAPARPFTAQTLAIDPLALPFGFASAEYERAIGRNGFAVGVGGLASFTDDGPLDRGESYRTLQIKLKYYPREQGLRGFAVGVTAGVAHARSMTASIGNFDENGSPVGFRTFYAARTAPTVGATLDYNFLIGRQRRFLVGLGLGAKRTLGGQRTADYDPLGHVLVDPRLQVGFGF